MPVQVAFDLAFCLDHEAEARPVAEQCGGGADSEGAYVPQRIQHTGAGVEFPQAGFAPRKVVGFLVCSLQQELARRRQTIPVVFITGNADRTVRPRVLAQGAVECLFKPFSDTALLDALNAAAGMR